MQLLFRALKNWALQVHVAKDNSIVGDELGFKTKFSAVKKKNLETSVNLSWKALLTEAKTQSGVQKCKVRV